MHWWFMPGQNGLSQCAVMPTAILQPFSIFGTCANHVAFARPATAVSPRHLPRPAPSNEAGGGTVPKYRGHCPPALLSSREPVQSLGALPTRPGSHGLLPRRLLLSTWPAPGRSQRFSR